MEVKQFTQGQFEETFEGSASDLIKQLTATPPVATPPANQTPAPATPPVTTSSEPLTPQNTLNPDEDAAKLLEQQPAATDESASGDDPAKAAAKAAAAKKTGRPVEKLDTGTRQWVDTLIKEQKLFGFQDGKIETVKDLNDLLDANFAHRDQLQEKTAYDRVFASMTPAMQFIASYAGQVDSPAELLPLIQTTSNAERFAGLDENNAAHQEIIVREKMRLQGDADEVIDQEITDLKDRGKLADRAKAYKPGIQKYYETQAQQMIAVKQREEAEYFSKVQENATAIKSVLDSETLDGLKLKNQHKGAIFELLAVPREEYGGGMGIYHIIDNLFMKGDFNRLAKIALLAGDEKAFEDVIGTKLRFSDADNTIRRLNINNGGNPTNTTDLEPPAPQAQVLSRPLRTGFGFSK